MDEVSVEALQQAVEGLHGCKAKFLRTEVVKEVFQGQTVWDGTVYVFGLRRHRAASIAYAWSDPVPDGDKRRFYAILGVEPVKSAQDAVRMAVVGEARTPQ